MVDKRRHRLSTPGADVLALVQDCLDAQANAKQTEADRKSLFVQLQSHYASWRAELSDVDVFELDSSSGRVAVSWVSGGVTKSLSAEKLLELGVDPGVIREATKETARQGHLDLSPVKVAP